MEPAHASRASLAGFGEVLLVYKPAGPADVDTAPMLQSVGGAELNSCVALARIDGRALVTHITILPEGVLGDIVVRAGESAGVRMMSTRSPHSEIGTMHVIDSQVHYQRRNSAFARQSGAEFDWPSLLQNHAWLHLTGITPLLGENALRCWQQAMQAARDCGVRVILDLNHRPALGTFERLWALVAPQLPFVHSLVLSESALEQLVALGVCGTEGGATHERGARVDAAPAVAANDDAIAEQLTLSLQRRGDAVGETSRCVEAAAAPPMPGSYAAHYAVLAAMRRVWGVALVICCFKCAEGGFVSHGGTGKLPPAAAGTSGGSGNTLKPGGNVRWAVVASEHGLAGTQRLPTHHSPVQATGGGDAWLAGFVSGLGALPAGEATPSPQRLQAACRRGDLLAALAQQSHGDLSHADGGQLAQLEADFRDEPAWIPPADDLMQPPQGSALEREEAVCGVLGGSCVLAVLTLHRPSDAQPVLLALARGGVRAVEVMLRTPAAEQVLAATIAAARALAASGGPIVLVGAGTVLSEAQAEMAAKAGAHFLVAPGCCPPVLSRARELGVPMVPGVCTPSEIELAMRNGCRVLKLFPAATLGGAEALRALAAPYEGKVVFVPTGGVSAESMGSYLALPAVLAVGGSWLVKLSPGPAGPDGSPIDLVATEAAALEAVAKAAMARPAGARQLPPPLQCVAAPSASRLPS